jgi:hypothetical protein
VVLGPGGKPLFGGNVGRKSRTDGLRPGSPEALAADRAKDAARKRLDRLRRSVATPPPPLPAAGNAGPAPPAGAPAPALGGESVALGVPADDFIPWTADDLEPLFAEGVVALGEEVWLNRFLHKAFVNGLPAPVIKKMREEGRFSETGKKLVIKGGAADLARFLNEQHVSARYKSSTQWIFGCLIISAGCASKLKARNETIAAHLELKKASEPAKPEPAKSGTN